MFNVVECLNAFLVERQAQNVLIKTRAFVLYIQI